ncbi:MAG: HlyD family secretion protein, partial [Pseudomonadota bacterium]
MTGNTHQVEDATARNVYVEHDGHRMAALSLSMSAIAVRSQDALKNGPCTFDLILQKGCNAVRLPLTGTVEETTETDQWVIEPDTPPHMVARLTAATAWMKSDDALPTTLFTEHPKDATNAPASHVRIHTRAHGAGEPKKTGFGGQLAVLAGCVLTSAYLLSSAQAYFYTTQASAAWVTTGGSAIASPSGGSVVYIAPVEDMGGVLQEGAPMVGLTSATGRSIAVDAPLSGRVLSTDVKIGDRIRRGDVLFQLAGDGVPRLVALVSQRQAVRLGQGATARVDIEGRTIVDVPVSAANIQGAASGAMPMPPGTVAVVLPTSDKMALTPEDAGQAVHVTF